MFIYIQLRASEKTFSIRRMCAALPVSESGFYKWKRNKDNPKAWQKLLAEIHKILDEDEENTNYGVERMRLALEQRGIKRSYSTVKRAMARGNLLHESNRSPDGLTKADRDAMKPENIIKQDFTAEAPLRKLHAVRSMSGVGKCWDNSRMESWFATLKKEKIYQIDTTKLTVEEVKTIVWRYTFAYYNTKRITTVNPGGLPPAVYRERTASVKNAA